MKPGAPSCQPSHLAGREDVLHPPRLEIQKLNHWTMSLGLLAPDGPQGPWRPPG